MNHCFHFVLNLRGHVFDHFDILCHSIYTTINIRQYILTQRKQRDLISHGVHAQSTFLFFQILRRAVVSSKNLGRYKVIILRSIRDAYWLWSASDENKSKWWSYPMCILRSSESIFLVWFRSGYHKLPAFECGAMYM